MKKLLLFTALVLAASVSAVYCLSLLDNIVHGTLYNFGLRFSYDWANPYWMLMRIVQAMIVLAAVFNVVSLIYVYRKYVYTKPQVMEIRGEKKVISSPSSSTTLETEIPSETQRMGGLVKCTHCNRVFSQPLRMLDFHSDRPRIINICPFCNEVIPPILRHEEAEREKKFAPKGKRNNHTKESQEIVQKEEIKATEETVVASA
jgi:hypothetical protein